MIIFPMAGRGQRFIDQGYALPKFQLPLAGEPVFHHVLNGFKAYFKVEPFLFICMNDPAVVAFVQQACQDLGIDRFHVATVDVVTRGQAETVLVGLQQLPAEMRQPDEPLTIFNIDTVRHNFTYPAWHAECDGYLEVFEADGDHWSFVEPVANPDPALPLAQRTTEKVRISNLCSNGLYTFKTMATFEQLVNDALAQWEATPEGQRTEVYIAPLYNELIAQGQKIAYLTIPADAIACCGTPAEYEAMKLTYEATPALT